MTFPNLIILNVLFRHTENRQPCFVLDNHFFIPADKGLRTGTHLSKFFILIVLIFKINVVALYKQIIEAMIRSIPNPPMDREDVARFHRNLEKHLRGDFSADERHRIEERKARTESITKRIIANCGGKNPILGY